MSTLHLLSDKIKLYAERALKSCLNLIKLVLSSVLIKFLMSFIVQQ